MRLNFLFFKTILHERKFTQWVNFLTIQILLEKQEVNQYFTMLSSRIQAKFLFFSI